MRGTIRAGIPTAIELLGILVNTTALAPMDALIPILIALSIFAPVANINTIAYWWFLLVGIIFQSNCYTVDIVRFKRPLLRLS